MHLLIGVVLVPRGALSFFSKSVPSIFDMYLYRSTRPSDGRKGSPGGRNGTPGGATANVMAHHLTHKNSRRVDVT